jgi:Holliday junction resolvasome RuvABC endonuclease subunit
VSLKVTKTKARRVMGIDCSTESLAFCIYQNRRPVKWGKIQFRGANVFERMLDARNKINMLREQFDVDFIAFEAAVSAGAKNIQSLIKLAMVYGVCIAELMHQDTTVVTVAPITWQSYIGVPNLKTAEKEQLKADFPGLAKSTYLAKARKIRKQRIQDFARAKWDFWDESDEDVNDAHGLAFYAYHVLTAR